MKKWMYTVVCLMLILNSCASTALAEMIDVQDTPPPPVLEPIEGQVLSIDTQTRYPGMNTTYAQGYEPTVSNGRVQIVLPLLANYPVRNATVQASIDLGNPNEAPFIFYNYQIEVMQSYPNGLDQSACYLIAFDLALKEGRYNGSYPVIVRVWGVATNGERFEQEFPLYVRIQDGIDLHATPSPTPIQKPDPKPKLIVSDYTLDVEQLEAGTQAVLTVTIENTSSTQAVNNLKLSFADDCTDILPLETASAYFANIKQGKTLSWTVPIRVRELAQQRPHIASITMQYEDQDGTQLQASDAIVLDVRQKARLSYEEPSLPTRVTEGDNLNVSMNFMNLGKSPIYNIVLEFQIPGLNNGGSVLVGTIEAGESKLASTNLLVRVQDQAYGDTQGTLLITYEDGYGEPFTKQHTLQTNIAKKQDPVAPVLDGDSTQTTGMSWWIWTLIGIGAVSVIGCIALHQVKARRMREEDEKRL